MTETSDAGSPGKKRALLGEAALLRVVGFWALAAAIINLTIGASIYVLPGTLAATTGPAAPLVFILGGLVFVPVALCFSAAGSRVSATGGPYAYVRAAFGAFPGFVIAAVFWISNAAGGASIAAALLDQVALLFPALAQPVTRCALVAVAYSLLSVLNARGIRAGTIAIVLLACAKVLPLALVATFGAWYVRTENLHAPTTLNWSTIGSSMVIVIFAYSGLENALSPSGEIRNPSSVVPRATLAAVAIIVALYVGLQFVAQGVLGRTLADHPAPLAAVADVVLPGSYRAMLVAASISMFGILQGDLLGSSRLVYALARDGYLPPLLARVSESRRVPVAAVVTHATAVVLLTLCGTFKSLALMSGGAFCLVYFGCCAAAWQLQRRGTREHGTPFVLPAGPFIPLIACAALILVVTTIERSEWLAIGYALLAVSILYTIARLRPGRRMSASS
jgi:APA family basic amino acid/polyamine antiporter